MTRLKLALTFTAASLLAAPAFAQSFETLDTNADGQVTFDEYRVHASAEGKTATLAAQEFTRMSAGDAIITADEMLLAEVTTDYSSSPSVIFDATPTDTPSEWTPVEIETSPVVGEVMMDPPVTSDAESGEDTTDGTETDWSTPEPTPESVITETPNEGVAGEVIMSDEAPIEIPMEEGLNDTSDLGEILDSESEMEFEPLAEPLVEPMVDTESDLTETESSDSTPEDE